MTKPKTGDPICDALDVFLQPDALAELAHHGRGARHASEAAAKLEQVAVVHDRASDGFAERRRYDLAAGERERARHMRRWAAALRVVQGSLP